MVGRGCGRGGDGEAEVWRWPCRVGGVGQCECGIGFGGVGRVSCMRIPGNALVFDFLTTHALGSQVLE